jgi:hypothetical protein
MGKFGMVKPRDAKKSAWDVNKNLLELIDKVLQNRNIASFG